MDVRKGRGLVGGDDTEAPEVVVVSESFARRFLGEGDPLGRRVKLAGADSATWLEVVGVVEDVLLGAGGMEQRERAYVALTQFPRPDVMALVLGAEEAPSLAQRVRRALGGVDPGMPVWSIRTLADAHAYLIRVPRAMGVIALGGGTAGLLVAAVGLYGLLAFQVRRRRRELGLRLALGADGARLAREVLTLALRQILPAILAGLTVAWILAPLLAVALMGEDPRAPLVYVGVAGAFLGVGLVAALAPALRAAALDPARVLRGE